MKALALGAKRYIIDRYNMLAYCGSWFMISHQCMFYCFYHLSQVESIGHNHRNVVHRWHCSRRNEI